MKFSYNWLKEYVPSIDSPQKVAADLTMGIFDVENVEQFNSDWLLDIKVLTNRAHDCLSHLGIAREIVANSGSEFNEPKIKLKEDKSLNVKDLLSVEVKKPKLCPRYSARVVVDIKVADSPHWIQERLKTCGLRPINNIVDITNYVMLECGQPLHAFDLDKINTEKTERKKIIVRKAQNNEKVVTLDEGRAERILNEDVLVIADEKHAIGIAGIKGGKGTEIDVKTRRIALEAANFNPVNIRQSSKLLNLRTDASWRFENSPDMNLTVWALERAAQLIADLAGGKVASGVIDVAAQVQKPWSAAVAHGYIESLLGIKIKPEQVLKIFARLDLPVKQIKKAKDLVYEVRVPTRRADLLNSEDLVEEIGRLFGYQNIASRMPTGELIPALENEQLLYLDETKDILTGLGFSEVYNYSLISEGDKKLYGLNNLAEPSNPLSQEQKYFRPNLATGLIKNLQANLKYFQGALRRSQEEALRLFEEGRVFSQQGKKIIEQRKMGGLVFLPAARAKDNAFYELKGVIEILFNELGLADVWDDDHIQDGLPINWKSILHPSKSAQIKVGQEILGYLGELHPLILSEMEIEARPAIFEFDFARIVELIDEERIYQAPSKYPAITRDLAIFVEANTKVEEVMNEIESAAGELLEDVDLFDVYEGEDLSDEQKSLAFHLIWQSPERNLSDVEINKLMEKIIKALKEKGWEIRK
jgi:phenylalanyl-tRNA synthetase beta chain